MTKRDTGTERFDKLVRDRIPEIIEENDETPIVSTAAGEEYTERLVEKLQEEVAEYAESREVEELADVLEVVHALRADTVGRNFVESRVTFSRSTVRIQPGECHDVTQSYVRQYQSPNHSSATGATSGWSLRGRSASHAAPSSSPGWTAMWPSS